MKIDLSKKILNIFKRNLGVKKMHLHEPTVDKNDSIYLKKCIFRKEIAIGEFVKKFEKKISKLTKSKYVVTTNSGTSALHISCLLLGVKPNDEVLVPAFTFIATANVVKYCNAIPHFVDIEENHFGINIPKLEKYLKKNTFKKNNCCINKKTKRIIRGIIPVHIFGHPIKIDKLINVAKKYNLFVLEDAAESLGSTYKAKHTGTFGDIGVLSFNGNKIITTGAGGAIITNKKNYAKKARHLIANAKLKGYGYFHDQVGFNYRMPNLNAALGFSQINKIKKLLNDKRRLFSFYKKIFSKSNFFKLVQESKNCRSNFWLQTVIVNKNYSSFVNKIIKILHKNKIYARPGWELLSNLKFYKRCPKMNLSISKSITKRIINIPSSSFLV